MITSSGTWDANGRRADGRRDGGDPFDALCRRERLDRGATLQRIVVPAMLAEASVILKTAARRGEGVPSWVAAITTPAGSARYEELRRLSVIPPVP